MTKSIPYLSAWGIAKRCIKCGAIKPIDLFHSDKQRKDGHYSQCKDCEHLHKRPSRSAQWSREHPGLRSISRKKHDDKNREEINTRKRKYRQEHLESIKYHNKEYKKQHPDIVKNSRRKRRAKMKGAGGRGITATDWQIIITKYGNKCLACGSIENITMDHVIPLAAGGTHDPDNVQPLCKSCNSKKAIKIIDYRPDIIQPRMIP